MYKIIIRLISDDTEFVENTYEVVPTHVKTYSDTHTQQSHTKSNGNSENFCGRKETRFCSQAIIVLFISLSMLIIQNNVDTLDSDIID